MNDSLSPASVTPHTGGDSSTTALKECTVAEVDCPRSEDAIVPLDIPLLRRASKLGPKKRMVSEPGNNRIRWESSEHTYLGDHITLRFDRVSGEASDMFLTLPNSLALTYGQVCALGGDFYGDPNKPISDAEDPAAQFSLAYQDLAVKQSSFDEAKQILLVMQEEIDLVNKAVSEGKQPSTVYAALGDTLSGKWNRITGGGSVFYALYPLGRYMSLANKNWDHFGSHAVTCYTAGHGVALAAAVVASKASGQQQKTMLLQQAYAMNAFADHYLTDLFSAGHIRTPRKQLYMSVTPSWLGSLLSREMHDEDCAYGLNVTNQAGDAWLAYGDKRLLDTENHANLAIVQSAVQTSADEVWSAYCGNPPSEYAALQKIANLGQMGYPDRKNPMPLFSADDGTTYLRVDINDPTKYQRKGNWWAATTFASLKSSKRFSDLGDNISVDVPSTLLLASYPQNRVYTDTGELSLYDLTQASVSPALLEPVCGGTFYAGCSSDILQFLTADVSGNGTSALCVCDPIGPVTFYEQVAGSLTFTQTANIAGANGTPIGTYFIGSTIGGLRGLLVDSLGMVTLYSKSSPTISGFDQAWQGFNSNWQSGVPCISVDRNTGQGFNLVQGYPNGGNLALQVFSAPLTGGALQALSTTSGATSPYSSNLLAVNPKGGALNDHLLQFTVENSVLNKYLYAPSADGNTYARVSGTYHSGDVGSIIGCFRVASGVDEIQRVLVVFATNNKVSMRLHEYGANGYNTVWASNDLGPSSYPSDSWFDVNSNVGGSTQLLQVGLYGSVNVYTYVPAVKAFTLSANLLLDVSQYQPLGYALAWSLIDGGVSVVPD